jgi:hypothetical protein
MNVDSLTVAHYHGPKSKRRGHLPAIGCIMRAVTSEERGGGGGGIEGLNFVCCVLCVSVNVQRRSATQG